MIHQVVTRVSLESFKEKSAGKKVVLLYPWTNYRNLFLSHFLQSAKEGLLYYRIPQDSSSLSEWLGGLVTELDDVLGGFGKNLKKALDGNDTTPQGLASALAKDLGALSGKDKILFVDELDRVPLDAEFDSFITTLVDALPKDVQLVFSSRLLHHVPWYHMVAKGDAIVLGTEYRKDDVMFTVEDEPKPQVEVYAFGRGHAVVNGKEISNWDGALPRQLFFYFVDREMVTRDDIFDTFWPDLSIKEATNVFHVTKRKISERISMNVKSDQNFELTIYTSGFYMPGDKVVRHYDAGDFQKAVDSAMMTDDKREQERLLRQAVDLYTSPFLETIDMPWVRERRAHLKQLHAEALTQLGRIHMARNENEEALGLLVHALKESPQREDVHRDVMTIYDALGMSDQAMQHFHKMEKQWKSKFKMALSPVTRDLYAAISAKA
ncbi:MAG: bacterial transcriptional activator domain-containing protein [Aggregatilineales bacterium]